MQKTLFNTIEFNGKRLSVLSKDGNWWVAIKPICEALGVDFEKQRERISRHPILAQLPTKQGVVAADNKVREMLCLPERFIYGWLFSINSDSPELIAFQRECYEVLYNHFHGALTGRIEVLAERSAIDVRIAELEQKMQESDEYQEILRLKKEKTTKTRQLRTLDHDLINTQLSLFAEPTPSDN